MVVESISHGDDPGDFSLEDALSDPGDKKHNSFWDVIRTTTTKKPKTTTPPPKHNPAKNPMDFDLADALDDKNDRKDPGRPNIRPGEGTLTSLLSCTLPARYRHSLADTVRAMRQGKEEQRH
ncbi:cd99 antigen-like protein 2 [Limosa lapponica baueri]|uniref:CD99 antigen-like protein 2 n=1 Tax=Limosa lapponica baueri TaxID=1758121 RepID=A0A2I0T7Y9_LIMLA|nr:cd99 antigen-like protein 2 [Limosa lapponica baueri]